MQSGGLLVDVADDQRRAVPADGHVQCFVELHAVVRELKGAAHLVAARILFLGDQTMAIPFCGDLLIVRIFGFLQFAPVGYERTLPVPIIRQIHFRARHRERNRIRWCEEFLHFLPFFIAFSAAPAVAPARPAGIPATHAAASAAIAPATAAIRTPGFLRLLVPVIALVAVELPSTQYDRARLLLWSLLLGPGCRRRRRTRTRLRRRCRQGSGRRLCAYRTWKNKTKPRENDQADRLCTANDSHSQIPNFFKSRYF